ncbi:MAG: response regulator [Methylococcales bacterium]|nr:response regulator [Methylococcales bacterium]
MTDVPPILLVEDDQVDIMIVKRGFRKLNVINELMVVNDGEQALAYLEHALSRLPSLILLDINMPKMNGRECLKQLKKHPVFKTIPVVMLSSSQERHDVDQCLEMGIVGYILKSVEFADFLTSIQVLKPYWIQRP